MDQTLLFSLGVKSNLSVQVTPSEFPKKLKGDGCNYVNNTKHGIKEDFKL